MAHQAPHSGVTQQTTSCSTSLHIPSAHRSLRSPLRASHPFAALCCLARYASMERKHSAYNAIVHRYKCQRGCVHA